MLAEVPEELELEPELLVPDVDALPVTVMVLLTIGQLCPCDHALK
jgi:hypothetical protein